MGALGHEEPFAGRDAELAALDGMLAAAAGGACRFALVTGERGMGRTTLLRRLSARASGARVLQASGEESEIAVPFGVVDQLARSAAPSLPVPLTIGRDRPGAPDEPAAVGMALLDLLHALQQASPVVVTVDDAHCADAPSQRALLFALRRLPVGRVLAVLTAADDAVGSLVSGLPGLARAEAGRVIHLGPLGDEAVHHLVSALGVPGVSRDDARRLREHTGGNPLLVRALVEELGDAALLGSDGVPRPVPGSVLACVLDRLTACPPPARRLVSAAAVVGPCPLSTARQVGGVDRPLEALQAAIDACLVRYRDRVIEFPHPLTRAAVYHAVPLSERCDLHRRAAVLATTEGAALRHRAAATLEEDEALAGDIEAFAAREAARGSTASAAELFHEAAALVGEGPRRDDDLVEAAELRLGDGDVLAAMAIAGRRPGLGDEGRSAYLRGRLALAQGDLGDAERQLRRAWELAAVEARRHLRGRIAGALAGVKLRLLRASEAVEWAMTALSCGQAGRARGALAPLALGLAMTGRVTEAARAVGSGPPGPNEEAATGSGDRLLARAICALYAGDPAAARHHAGLADRATRPAATAPEALLVLAVSEYRLGAWDDALRHADAGMAGGPAEGTGSPSALHAAMAWPRAGRGEWEAAEAHAAKANAAAAAPIEQAFAGLADAVVGRARGDHQRVVDAVARLRAVDSAGALDEPAGLWPWQELLVESLIGMARLDEADDELARFEARAAAGAAPVTRCTAARLRGQLEMAAGRRREADEAFRGALEHSAEAPAPFDRALAHASYGAFLRRTGERSAAAVQLGSALAGFAALGARPFLDRCQRELAAGRLAPRRSRRCEPGQLTAQERSVVRLVAEGKRNREVAAELIVSVNTVEYHLKNVYAKLGISSRSQLIVRMRDLPHHLVTGP
ncbi:MAG: helix-turn-helix transcriptional regulator [Acidimicrobiia bacterium]